ncbi:MAG: polyprenyl synthetase family protein [Evtepia gabavorous]
MPLPQGSTPEEEAAAAAYARKLGLAFQVRDDILDVMGDEGSLANPLARPSQSKIHLCCIKRDCRLRSLGPGTHPRSRCFFSALFRA